MDPTSGSTSGNSTPTISAHAPADGTVKIYVGAALGCTTQYGSDAAVTLGNDFNVTGSLSGNGTKVFSYKYTDANNVTSACLSTGLSYTYQQTITYNLSRTFYTIKETGSYVGASVRISRDVAGLAQDVTLAYSAVTALSGTHFTAGTSTVSFSANDTYKDIPVGTFGVSNRTGTTDYDRYFIVQISTIAANAAIGSTDLAQVNIIDTDVTGEYFFPHSLFSVSDSSGNATLTVQRMTTGATATVDVEFDSGSAVSGSDFTGTTVTANFSNTTDTEVTVSVPIANVASNRSFMAKIKKITSNTVRAQSLAKVRILDSSESNTCDASGAPFGGGTGVDSGHPYLICSLAQMQQVTNNKTKYFKVMSDIDLAESLAYIPATFTGTFDGNERILYRFKPTCAGGSAYCALFSVVGSVVENDAIIKNVNMLYATVITAGAGSSAILVGKNNQIGGGNYTTILRNNMVSGYVYANSDMNNGMITGSVSFQSASRYITAEYNFSTGLLSGTNSNNGGLTGYTSSSASVTLTYNYNYNSAAIIAAGYAGGLFGYIQGGSNATEQVWTGLENRGPIISSQSHAGGIVGSFISAYALTLSGNKNLGVVSGVSSIGGIIGRIAPSSGTFIIKDSTTNTGVITASTSRAGGIVGDFSPTGNTTINFLNDVNTGNISGPIQVGGILGIYVHGNYAGQTLLMQGNSNSGNINASTNGSSTGAGGILGDTAYNANQTLDSITINGGNTNSGTITGGNQIFAGGIVGYLTVTGAGGGSSVLVNSNSNTGNIGSAGAVGGVVGGINTGGTYGTITVSNNSSTVAANITTIASSAAGGIIGTVTSATGTPIVISGNTNYSTLTAAAATNCVGGLMGYYSNSTNAANTLVYSNANYGNITGGIVVGGLIGNINISAAGGTNDFTKNRSSGAITSNSNFVGGLFGTVSVSSASTLNIKESYTASGSGSITGTYYVGGFIGRLTNSAGGTVNIEDSYTDQSAVATVAQGSLNYLGGIIGLANNTGSTVNITNVVSRAALSWTSTSGGVGGLTGGVAGNAINYTSSYWLKDAGGTNTSVANDGYQKTTANLQDVSTYSGWTFTPAGGALWTMGTYPTLVNAP